MGVVGTPASWSLWLKGIGISAREETRARHSEAPPEGRSSKMDRGLGEAEVAGAGTQGRSKPSRVLPAQSLGLSLEAEALAL